jgi:hemerythrin
MYRDVSRELSSVNKPVALLLEWEPRYSVHVAEIDEEHRVWFALINGLYFTVLEKADKRILRTVLAETTQYTFAHFAHEEKLMEEIDYPEHEKHVLEHEHLAREARAFTERLGSGQCATVIEYLVFLSEWVRHHTMTTDRALGDYINAHSVD